MRGLLAVVAACCLLAGPASAAKMLAVYTGTVETGENFTASFLYEVNTPFRTTTPLSDNITGGEIVSSPWTMSATFESAPLTFSLVGVARSWAQATIIPPGSLDPHLYAIGHEAWGGPVDMPSILEVIGFEGPYRLDQTYDGGLVDGLGAVGGAGGPYFTLVPTHLTITAVPEPSTWALMIVGFGLLGGMMRRRPRCTPQPA